jgi:hypothetical protein
MKRITALLLFGLLWTAYVMAQSSMTDHQVMDYVMEENAKGKSRQQIVTQLMQRGVTKDQMRRIQRKYQRQTQNGFLGAEDVTARSSGERMREANVILIAAMPTTVRTRSLRP